MTTALMFEKTKKVAMVDVATELKKYGKTKEGSVVVFDRRRPKRRISEGYVY